MCSVARTGGSALDKEQLRGENYIVTRASGIFCFPLELRASRRGFCWAGYFRFMLRLNVALFFAALVAPWFRPLVEWALSLLWFRPFLAAQAGFLVFRFLLGSLRNPIIFSLLVLLFLALDFAALPRLLKRERGPVLLRGAMSWLKYTLPHLAVIFAFDAFLIAYHAFLGRMAAPLLLACAAVLLLAMWDPLLLHMFARRGLLPDRGALPAAAVAAAAAVLLAGLPFMARPTVQAVAAALFLLSLGLVCLRLRASEDPPEHGRTIFNARLLILILLAFTAVRGAIWVSHPGRAPAGAIEVLANPGPVYDVLSVDGGRSVIFSPKLAGQLGRVRVSDRSISWSSDPKKRTLMRMAYIKEHGGIAVTTWNGLPLYDAKTLAFKRLLTRESYDYIAADEKGDSLYATSEPHSKISIVNLLNGSIRKYTFGHSLLYWPYDVDCGPRNQVFISNWISSPMFVKMDAGRPAPVFHKKHHGFFSAGMALDPAGNRIFLARTFFRRIDVLDMDTLEVVDEIPSLFGIRELAYSPERDLIFAPSFFTGDVQIVDLKRRRYFTPFNAGRRVRSVFWEPRTQTLYMGAWGGIFMIRPKTLDGVLSGRGAVAY